MSLNVTHCKRCKIDFESHEDRCPSCGVRTEQGLHNLRVKWMAVLFFLIALASIAYAWSRMQHGE
jgi:hypothetical protein